MRQPDDWTEIEALECQLRNEINALEVLLKTAKSDGIREAVKSCEVNFMGEKDLRVCLSGTLIKYANNI